ncbi:hypothetical protein LQG66_10695 [Bradyrhizobium ontarionense]|uniref:Apea-like HEPN domain-containing protein n=1 Tax=Bradyrhizobium ontarionense TaxID=2898149 RepID=A0ABY3RGX3_9BRAD|nr:hypothetical protein [Bradyrhizobium sp. A19]UFZ06729.1 hypothetical protein LQG66_10695 [Bradyrhizobium sp. A19]
MSEASNGTEASNIQFLLEGELEEISFNPELPGGLHFTDESTGIKIKLFPRNPAIDPFRPLVFQAETSAPASHSAKRFITSLGARKFETYDRMPITLPYHRGERTLIDAHGNLSEGFGVPFELYPPEVQNLFESVKSTLSSKAERFVRLLRWQQSIDGPHWIFSRSHSSLYWSTEGGSYHLVRARAQEKTFEGPAGIEWKEEDQADLKSAWDNGTAEEGIAHELLREARALRGNSPRSAYIVAISALEVGVKTYLGNLSPEMQWLLAELPSPPIHKILRSYIPELHASRGRPVNYWDKLKPVFKRVEQYATTRNKLIHTGAIEIKPDDLTSCLNDVSDILYLFDYLHGYEWAKHNLSHKLLSTLGWPASRRKRTIIKWLANPI